MSRQESEGSRSGAERRTRWSRSRVAALALALALGGGAAPGQGDHAVAGTAPGQSWPTPMAVSVEPLGSPQRLPVTSDDYVFTQLQADGETPVAYDPCRAIHYVVRPDHAPPAGGAVLRAAMARISEVTGLTFVYDGTTDEDPSAERPQFQPERYGDRWVPVLVTWETAQENPAFARRVIGQAGSGAARRPGVPVVFVTGLVRLNAAWFTEALADPEREPAARAAIMHELAHLVGLSHVSAPSQLMYPGLTDTGDFGPGDLTGLARLGEGECVPQL